MIETNKTIDVAVIIVGDELMTGRNRDGHLQYFGRILGQVGVRPDTCTVVGDDPAGIAGAVRSQIKQARLLLVCGGLGPTADDVTREAVAAGLDVPLEFNKNAWAEIQAYFAKLKRPIADTNRKQAFFPAGATCISNSKGTAPGFYIRQADCLTVVLPGPPHELRAMVESVIVPMLSSVFGEREPVFTETFRTTGIGESTLASMLEDVFPKYEQFSFSSLFSPSGVDIIITDRTGSTDQTALAAWADNLGRELANRLGPKFYGLSGSTLEGRVGELLTRRKETVSLAESLTGGLIGKRITDVPGSSVYFLADVVAYSNPSKMDLLDVSAETLIRVGAVSDEVAAEMARGIRQRTGATWGLSTTGIAGPDGGTVEKPTGLCYYALAGAGGETVKRYEFPGSRELVRERVAYAALALLFAHLRESEA